MLYYRPQWEGNVFTAVCLSTIDLMATHSLLGLTTPRLVCILLQCFLVTFCNVVAARLCFHRRLWFCSQGVCIPACIGADTPLADTPSRHTSPRRPLQRTVRILLECILVWITFILELLHTVSWCYVRGNPPNTICEIHNCKLNVRKFFG